MPARRLLMRKIHRELKRDGVTLQLLWEEHLQVHPSGYRYTQFCEFYRRSVKRLRPSMRQVHRAGEKTFIDFSGKRPSLVDRRTGELRPVELFVSVLGASGFTYAEATRTQQLPDWVDAHIRMVEYFGGATTMWIPDQLKSAITRPCRYEAGVNRTYEDLAAHYGRGRHPGAAEETSRPSSSSVRSTPRSASCSTSSQRPADEEAGRQPPRPLRATRPPGAAAPARRTLRPRALEALPREH